MAARNVVKVVENAKLESLDNDALEKLVDQLQRGLMDIHGSMARMYFLPVPEAVDAG